MGLPSLDAIPPPPREPSPRARELIYRYQAGQKVVLLIGSIFAAVGLGLIAVFNWGMAADLFISLTGRPQHGRVLFSEIDREVNIEGRSATLIHFAYSIDGQRYEGQSSTLDGELIRAAVPDARIPIQVSRLNPHWARASGSILWHFEYGRLIVLIFSALGLIMIAFTVRSHRRDVRAFSLGTPARAKVVGFGPDYSTIINGRNPFQVRWEFKVDERIYSGSLSSMSMLALEELGKAQEIVVLYDPAHPSINTAWVD